MRLYLAGPVSLGGTLPPDTIKENTQRFYEAELGLVNLGYEVILPVREGDEDLLHHPQSWWTRRGFVQLLSCDGVALLPNWHTSPGTLKEIILAGLVEIPVHPFDYWRMVR